MPKATKLTTSLSIPQSYRTAAGGPLVNTTGSPLNGRIASQLPLSAATQRPVRVITTKPQVPLSDLELRARVQWGQRSSNHFQLSYDRLAFADPQIDTLIDAIESAYQSVFGMTHESFAGSLKIYAIDHRMSSLLGRAVRAHYNSEEHAIYLVQTSSQHLHSELVRLVAHAMRGNRYHRHYGQTRGWALLEESFSIFLNHRLSMVPEVYPFYGADPDVIAHHLFTEDACSLSATWPHIIHLCDTPQLAFEHSILGGAFFLYLGDTYSDDQIVTFSKLDGEVSSGSFHDFFGGTLEALEESWKLHLPSSLITHTHSEQEEMISHWEKQIEYQRNC